MDRAFTRLYGDYADKGYFTQTNLQYLEEMNYMVIYLIKTGP
jgi:hypothetical protein